MMRRGLGDITAAGMVVDMVECTAVAMAAMFLGVVGMVAGMVNLALAVDMVVVEVAAVAVAMVVDTALATVDMVAAVILE